MQEALLRNLLLSLLRQLCLQTFSSSFTKHLSSPCLPAHPQTLLPLPTPTPSTPSLSAPLRPSHLPRLIRFFPMSGSSTGSRLSGRFSMRTVSPRVMAASRTSMEFLWSRRTTISCSPYLALIHLMPWSCVWGKEWNGWVLKATCYKICLLRKYIYYSEGQ